MAVQKLHEFCEAEKRKIFALRKIIVKEKLSKKFDRLAKYIYYIEISLSGKVEYERERLLGIANKLYIYSCV